MVIKMKRWKWHNVLPIAAIVVFLAAGLVLMMLSIGKQNDYMTALAEAKQALTAADPAKADAPETELAALQAENAALEAAAEDLQEENAALQAQQETLQQEHDALKAQEDTVYYQTILDSLKEGLSKVEEYIRGDE